ncbi:MAG: hypothetical protein IPK71_01635 [Myxococcales bacterium]|nr:hypothetical protein [Myxococcales bacterium]
MAHRTPPPSPLTDDDVNAIALEAAADPRTVLRVLVGLPVRGRPGERIAGVLADRGVTVARTFSRPTAA